MIKLTWIIRLISRMRPLTPTDLDKMRWQNIKTFLSFRHRFWRNINERKKTPLISPRVMPPSLISLSFSVLLPTRFLLCEISWNPRSARCSRMCIVKSHDINQWRCWSIFMASKNYIPLSVDEVELSHKFPIISTLSTSTEKATMRRSLCWRWKRRTLTTVWKIGQSGWEINLWSGNY